MRRLRWIRKLFAIGGVALVTAIGATLVGDDAYMRFATLDHTIQNRVRWVYERIHFDPAPIDIVVIGSSRTEAAVSTPRLEADLAKLGHPARTVNFSLPEAGRDLNWVLLQETFKTKSPRLIVIGVTEKPSRYGHPAYKYIASASDVVDPAYLGNLNYLTNLIYLPYRQVRLGLAYLAPWLFDLPTRFDRRHYTGSNQETTMSFVTGDGIVVDRNHRIPREELLAKVAKYEAGVRLPLLGPRWRGVEFGDERTYLARMVHLAHAHRARVVFLFIPYYTGPKEIQERAFYSNFGPVLDPSFVSTHDNWYSDVAHLNHAGAIFLTDWLALQLGTMLVR